MDGHHDHPIIKWLVGSTLTIFRRSDPYQIVGEISSKMIKSSVLSHDVLMFVQFCSYVLSNIVHQHIFPLYQNYLIVKLIVH